jgi:hypothetical protein
MRVVNNEGFLFPNSQHDFRSGGFHGLGRISDDQIPMVQTRLGLQPLYMNSDQIAALSSEYPDLPIDSNGDLLRSTFLKFFIAKKFPNPTTDYDKKARAEYEGIIADLMAYEASPQAAIAAAAAAAPLRDALGQVESYARAVSGANSDIRSLAQALRQTGDSVGARALENIGAELVAKANQALAGAQAAAAAGDLSAVKQFAQVVVDLTTDIRRQVQVADNQVAATAAEAERVRQAAAAVAAADAAEIARNKAAAEAAAAAAQAAAQKAAADEAARQAAAVDAAQKAARAEWDAANPQLAAKMQAEREAEAARVAQAAKDAAVAASTQKTAVDTTSGAVQTTDTASGTTSTVNAATGRVTLTNTSGQTVTGTGSVAAGGVITTVDTTTGTVTTQNTNTGVVTQTNAATGQTVTAVQVTGTAATGGTFILPDGGTVTTTAPITETATGVDAGKLALIGLLGVLLLRGAIR